MKNPIKRRLNARARNLRKRTNGGNFTREDVEIILEKCNYKCLACGTYEDLTIDHVVPVLLGGKTEISNSQVLCRSCNASKGTKIIDYRKQTII